MTILLRRLVVLEQGIVAVQRLHKTPCDSMSVGTNYVGQKTQQIITRFPVWAQGKFSETCCFEPHAAHPRMANHA